MENKNTEDEYKKYNDEIINIEKTVKDNLKEILIDYKKLKDCATEDVFSQEINSLVEKILLPIRFLIKHASFEEESERRILFIKSLYDEEVKNEDGRYYVPYKVPVIGKNDAETYLEKLYLGPKVPAIEELRTKVEAFIS